MENIWVVLKVNYKKKKIGERVLLPRDKAVELFDDGKALLAASIE